MLRYVVPRLDSAILRKVVSLDLIADPTEQRAVDAGLQHPADLDGLLTTDGIDTWAGAAEHAHTGFRQTAYPQSIRRHTYQYCFRHDLVCNFNLGNLNPLNFHREGKTHGSYPFSAIGAAAAQRLGRYTSPSSPPPPPPPPPVSWPSLGPIIPLQLPPGIAYYNANDGFIGLMAPDGSDAHDIGSLYFSYPAWSPDAQQLLYLSGDTGAAGIGVMNADGSNAHLIVDDPTGGPFFDLDPVWSPSGDQILFTRATPNAGAASVQIYLANADGSNLHPVPNTDGATAYGFTPDGQYIVFEQGSRPHIYVIRPDGTGEEQITDGGGEIDASWSPDGTSLIYDCFDAAGRPYHQLCEISQNDPTPRVLFSDETADIHDPTWNADGTEIMLTIGTYPDINIAMLSPAGGSPTVLGTPGFIDPNW